MAVAARMHLSGLWDLVIGGMNMKYLKLALAGAAACAVAGPAFATACSLTDISPTALACSGGYDGNVLSNNPADVAIEKTGLAAIGFTWDGTHFGSFPKLSPLGGATNIDFPGLLHGISYVGIHVGGKGGGQTTFYKFDAGSSLDAFTLHLADSSGAVLYWTDPGTPSVPEPASWALMLGGFGLVGGALRSHRRSVSFA